MPQDYLASLCRQDYLEAMFIERIEGVSVDTDKWRTLARLRPGHDAIIQSMGFFPQELWLAEQVHGVEIADIDQQDIKTPHLIAHVDGLITRANKRCLLGIYVADCAAIWLFDPMTRGMALLHSGKKGTEGNITQRAIDYMQNHYGSNPQDILAVISPCIHPPHYEIDISALIYSQLLDAGINAQHISDSAICTASNTDHFYSYRVEKGATGRMLALLGSLQ